MKSPVATARAAVKAALAAGLNEALAFACGQYNTSPISIDITNPNQCVEAQVTYGDIEESGYPQGAAMALYGTGAVVFPKDTGKWLFTSQWCGTVQIVADVWISITKELIGNFDYSADAFEAAFLGTMNSTATAAVLNAAGGLLFNQEISCLRQKPMMDGESWIIPMRFPMSFEVYL